MVKKITENIEVGVIAKYEKSHPVVGNVLYIFSYEITIKNLSDYTVVLKRRHWYIFDSIGEWKEVEGEGVVGLQPVLEPGQSHTYQSGSHLISGIGAMSGTYTMERQVDGAVFDIAIPKFKLEAPFFLN
jgi:ApaG protein